LELWYILVPEIQMRSTLLLMVAFTLQAPARTAGIDDVAWLTGCWEYSSGARTVEEYWLAPRARTMMNAGRTVHAFTVTLRSDQETNRRKERLSSPFSFLLCFS